MPATICKVIVCDVHPAMRTLFRFVINLFSTMGAWGQEVTGFIHLIIPLVIHPFIIVSHIRFNIEIELATEPANSLQEAKRRAVCIL